MSEHVGVVGLGLLGRGIVACFLKHGFQVVAVDRSEAQLAQVPGATSDFSQLAGCTFVVESVTEDVGTKDEVLAAIETVVSATTVIASNTSAIPISQLQARRAHPARFIGMHWAEPAEITRFMELICGEQTSPETLATAEAMARRLGKDPCVVRKDIPGFIVNRIGYAMYREALHLLDTGVADAETIDRAVRNALGLWATVCGPFRWMDITGGPAAYARAMTPVLPTLCNATAPSPTMQRARFHECSEEEAKRWEELYHRHAQRVGEMQREYFGEP
ncbi:MAG: 3-hydroxyacyl-CoA dehydrogenase family protein [Chthoniobacteraceae bacterium]